MPSIGEVRSVVDGWYPPGDAESWDAVGLVCGDPDEPVTRILLAVDAVASTVAQAQQRRAELLITHHPLLLRAVHGVPADDVKGALVHRMIRAGIAHLVAHTNAEVTPPGVSDALAALLGVTDVQPIEPVADPPLDKLTVFVPREHATAMIDALAAAGAGQVGDYDRCAWWGEGQGTFRPGAHARPSIGRAGAVEVVAETRVEMVLPASRRPAVLAAMRRAHPYEQPAFDLLTHAALPGRRGVGRIGTLAEPVTLIRFAHAVAAALPATAVGVRASGDPNRLVERVAVLAGSGSSVITAATAAGADVLVTADLKHHDVVEAVTQRAGDGRSWMALVDASHWATEVPWLGALAVRLRARFGDTVDVVVSDVVTDPWALHLPSPDGVPS